MTPFALPVAALCLAVLLPGAGAAPEPTAPPAAARANVFPTRAYQPTPLPTFAGCRDRLPQPVVAERPELEALYWKAWELAFRHLMQPAPGSGFVSNFIDPAFNQNTFQWDTCFMVMFATYAEPMFHAVGSLDNFYAKQHPDGFIHREITRATGKDFAFGGPQDYANPPLFSWAEWQAYLMTGDRSRFQAVLPPLARHYQWLKANRRRPNGMYWNTGLGSGLDDLARGGSFYWLDMTCQQAQNAYFIGQIAQAVGDLPTAEYFAAENRALARLVNQSMWEPKTGFYYDLKEDGAPTGVKTVIGFWPLLAHLATPRQAAALVKHLTDPKEFLRPNVIPALAACERGYTPDGQYWNGAVWAPTNFMVLKGLQAYGYDDLAAALALRYLDNMAQVLAATGTIWENYAPEKPVGHGARDMVGWSGVGPIALLMENVLGVRPQAASRTVLWRPRLRGENGVRGLTVGNARVTLLASALKAGRRALELTTDSPLTVIVDTGVGEPRSLALTPGTVRLKVRAHGMRLMPAEPKAAPR